LISAYATLNKLFIVYLNIVLYAFYRYVRNVARKNWK